MTPTDPCPLGCAERRRHRRFPTVIEAKWMAEGIRGTAAVHNLSSGGVFLKPERVMSIGTEITVIIDWPAAVPGRGSLALVIEGTVVRSDDAGSAIAIRRHEWKLNSPQPVTTLLPRIVARN